MSDTPITDAAEFFLQHHGMMVRATDMRVLEHELAEAKKDVLRYQYLLKTNANPTGCVLSNELRNKIDKAMQDK
jgi:hypothetical protein